MERPRSPNQLETIQYDREHWMNHVRALEDYATSLESRLKLAQEALEKGLNNAADMGQTHTRITIEAHDKIRELEGKLKLATEDAERMRKDATLYLEIARETLEPFSNGRFLMAEFQAEAESRAHGAKVGLEQIRQQLSALHRQAQDQRRRFPC